MSKFDRTVEVYFLRRSKSIFPYLPNAIFAGRTSTTVTTESLRRGPNAEGHGGEPYQRLYGTRTRPKFKRNGVMASESFS